MTIINLFMLNLYFVPCGAQMAPISQVCHLSHCIPFQTTETNESHDCRSQILARAWQDAVQAVAPETRMGKHGKSFVTVAEAVICDSVPLWWYREIRRGVVGKEHRVGFHCRQLKNLWYQDSNGVDFSGVDELSIHADGLHVDLSGNSLLVPMSILEAQLGSTKLADAGAFALCITENDVVLALNCPTEAFGSPESLVCIDRKAGTLKWTGKLDQHVTGSFGYSGSPTPAYTEITATDSRIAVYSASQHAVSLQCFNVDTGVKELTFVSNRVNSRRERADQQSAKFPEQAKESSCPAVRPRCTTMSEP